jgi:hypothetical protein
MATYSSEITEFLSDFPITFKKINGEIEIYKYKENKYNEEKSILIRFEIDVLNKLINVQYMEFADDTSHKLKFYLVSDIKDKDISVDGDFEKYIQSVMNILKCDTTSTFHSVIYKLDNFPSCTTNILNYKKCEDEYFKNIRFMTVCASDRITNVHSLYEMYMTIDTYENKTKESFEQYIKSKSGLEKEILERCMHIKFKSS